MGLTLERERDNIEDELMRERLEKEVRAVSKEILRTGIDYVCMGHCTKDRAYNIMKEELGDKLSQLRVGLEIKF